MLQLHCCPSGCCCTAATQCVTVSEQKKRKRNAQPTSWCLPMLRRRCASYRIMLPHLVSPSCIVLRGGATYRRVTAVHCTGGVTCYVAHVCTVARCHSMRCCHIGEQKRKKKKTHGSLASPSRCCKLCCSCVLCCQVVPHVIVPLSRIVLRVMAQSPLVLQLHHHLLQSPISRSVLWLVDLPWCRGSWHQGASRPNLKRKKKYDLRLWPVLARCHSRREHET
jgi:hypothetical protein